MADLEWTAGVLDGTVETHGASRPRGRRRRGERRGGRGRRPAGRQSPRDPEQQHARGTKAKESGYEADARSRAARAPLAAYRQMVTGDPVLQMKISNLELLCKSEALMAWGAGRHYDRCLSLLSYVKLVQCVKSSSYMVETRNSRERDGITLCQPTGAVLAAYELGEAAVERRQQSLRWIRFEIPQFNQLQDSGECAAWFTGLFVFIEALKANREDNPTLERVVVGLPPLADDATVPEPMNEIFVRGMTELFRKLVSLSEVVARLPGRLVVEFRSTAGYEALYGLWMSAFAGRTASHVCATAAQKMAFLMGMHERLGAASPVSLSCRDTNELILTKVEGLRLQLEWSQNQP